MKRKETRPVLVDKIIEGIQNKKGHRIAVVDLRQLSEAPSEFFVIAEGNSNTQVSAIVDEVEDFVRKETREKPISIDGMDNSEWVAMDYSTVIVHIFQREPRAFYDIEHLWADANITELEDI